MLYRSIETISFAMKKEILQGKTRCVQMGLGLVLALPLVSPAVVDEELRLPATEQSRAANAAVLGQGWLSGFAVEFISVATTLRR